MSFLKKNLEVDYFVDYPGFIMSCSLTSFFLTFKSFSISYHLFFQKSFKSLMKNTVEIND